MKPEIIHPVVNSCCTEQSRFDIDKLVSKNVLNYIAHLQFKEIDYFRQGISHYKAEGKDDKPEKAADAEASASSSARYYEGGGEESSELLLKGGDAEIVNIELDILFNFAKADMTDIPK